MFRSRKSRSERINRINRDNQINILSNQDFIGISDKPARGFDDKSFDRDVVSEDIGDDFFSGQPTLADRPGVSKVKTAVGLLALAGLGVGAGFAIKKAFSKKKEITKQDILEDVLNNKSIEELKGLVLSPGNKTKEQLVKEIVNKII